MASWDAILRRVHASPLDAARKEYLNQATKISGRNLITYYSAWLSKDHGKLAIDDSDMTGFMNAVHGLNSSKGLDLVLHTPGGDPTAAESIVNYLRTKFNKDLRVIVPHMAMSAGTMIACAAKEILMGKHSSLGPVDPQFGNIPAYHLKQMYEDAKKELAEDPRQALYWRTQLERIPTPAFIYRVYSAIELSSSLLKAWLGSCMYDSSKDSDNNIIANIVSALNENAESKTHSRHFCAEDCKKFGLKIKDLEADNAFQDAILSLHHSTMITLEQSSAYKIIDSSNGKSYICTVRDQ